MQKVLHTKLRIVLQHQQRKQLILDKIVKISQMLRGNKAMFIFSLFLPTTFGF